MSGQLKVVVRHALYIDSAGGLAAAGPRHFRGEDKESSKRGARFPRECVDKGSFIFHFNTAEEAETAAKKLQNYLDKTER